MDYKGDKDLGVQGAQEGRERDPGCCGAHPILGQLLCWVRQQVPIPVTTPALPHGERGCLSHSTFSGGDSFALEK